ncbi:hypothetical protein CI610_00115 [invertebrate metagenome]|uniref:Uncharacterized protein n=1 Tax=invertebrate metagenome TaxID=1711999 RepID=A0A2H9TCE5_9ZZZZ
MKILISSIPALSLLLFFNNTSYGHIYTFVETVWKIGKHPFDIPKKLEIKRKNNNLIVSSNSIDTFSFSRKAGTRRNIDTGTIDLSSGTRFICPKTGIKIIHLGTGTGIIGGNSKTRTVDLGIHSNHDIFRSFLFFNGSEMDISTFFCIIDYWLDNGTVCNCNHPDHCTQGVRLNTYDCTYVSHITAGYNRTPYIVSVIIINRELTLTLINDKQPYDHIKVVYQRNRSLPKSHQFIKE